MKINKSLARGNSKYNTLGKSRETNEKKKKPSAFGQYYKENCPHFAWHSLLKVHAVRIISKGHLRVHLPKSWAPCTLAEDCAG